MFCAFEQDNPIKLDIKSEWKIYWDYYQNFDGEQYQLRKEKNKKKVSKL